MGKYSGNYSVKGYAKYTDKGNSAETGHSGNFSGSTAKIGNSLARSVPNAGGDCAKSASNMVVNRKYTKE